MAKLELGRYAHCYECGTYTRIEDDAKEGECGQCLSQGDDSWITEVVDVIPCDNDPERGECTSENHHYGLDSQHVIHLDVP
jgi:hypothetical protein